MKLVNFLPDWYHKAQRDRRSLRFRIVLMALMGLTMITWTSFSRLWISDLRHQRDDLLRQGEITRNLDLDITKAEDEIRRLENLQLAYKDLGHTIPMSAVLQQLPNNMTQGMALSRVTIDVRPEPIKSPSNTLDGKTARFHDVARLTVVGIAPNDVLIAQLIGRISANPLFSDVSLNYTRTESLREHSVRRFEIQMTMDLDRLATADPAAQHAGNAPSEGKNAL